MSNNTKDKHETIKIIIDFQSNALFQTANLTAKGMAYYLAIFAAINGYIFTQDIPQPTKKAAMIIGVVVSFLAAAVGLALLLGINKGLKCVEDALKELDKELFIKLEVKQFFERGRKAFMVGAICAFSLVLIFSIMLLAIF